ncbi:glycosyltransferase family 2 protein [Nocardioides allogilvus]|uniref:glycosyltransferase family 2 protein n=1 Tax=Nocardioides allogilvus TaxID=2072017 RepID=UPI000D2F637E|nr:glycosyltransferase family 2 protein [Nocardioides allogilvus]
MSRTVAGAGSTVRATSLDEVLARAGVEARPFAEGECFLTVVMRTQGRRIPCLAESLGSLAEQTDRDFEVVLVRHRAASTVTAPVDAVVAAQPEWLRAKIRVLDLDTGARGAPLNLGFEAARGSYIVILDDDDVVLPAWVATFRQLHDELPGRALRAVALRQDVEPMTKDGQTGAAPVGEPYAHWPAQFHLLDHLLMNNTPPMTIAFPRAVFHDLGERFDEELDTTEDWDFLLRAVTLVGVAETTTVTALYRWWLADQSSHHLHDDAHWARNHDLVQRRLDDRVLLLPHGTVKRLQELVELPRIVITEVTEERDRLAATNARLEAQVARLKKKLERNRRRLQQAPPATDKPRLFGRKRG